MQKEYGRKLLRMSDFTTCVCWFDLGEWQLDCQVALVYIFQNTKECSQKHTK